MLEVIVRARQLEAEGIVSFELVAADGGELPGFEAGAHIELSLAEGLVRAYSLCNHPAERDRYQIAVQREPSSRGGSAALHERVWPGARLQIGAPRNHFPLAPGDAPSVLLAGGIGVTPLLCMAEQLSTAGRPFQLHYTARSRERLAFTARLGEPRLASHVRLYTDDGPAQQRFDAAALLRESPREAHLYVCGPAGFMDAVLDAARSAGWPEARLHREYFGAAPASGATGGDTAFELVLARSGRRLTVAADVSALQVLQAAGVDVPSSCEQGVCGTCLTAVLEGEPDHRDLYLTEEERERNDSFLPCCSRARTASLTLDL